MHRRTVRAAPSGGRTAATRRARLVRTANGSLHRPTHAAATARIPVGRRRRLPLALQPRVVVLTATHRTSGIRNRRPDPGLGSPTPLGQRPLLARPRLLW